MVRGNRLCYMMFLHHIFLELSTGIQKVYVWRSQAFSIFQAFEHPNAPKHPTGRGLPELFENQWGAWAGYARLNRAAVVVSVTEEVERSKGRRAGFGFASKSRPLYQKKIIYHSRDLHVFLYV